MNDWKSKRSAEYAAKLKDPRWQKKRLEILERDGWACQSCDDDKSMLVVHHRYYEKGREPWEHGNHTLVTLCQACHDHEHECYPQYAETLIQCLKAKGFLADDAFSLVDGFSRLEVKDSPQITAGAIEFALSDPETMDFIFARFDAHTKRRIELRKLREAEAKKDSDLG